jgi:hypothetical protein
VATDGGAILVEGAERNHQDIRRDTAMKVQIIVNIKNEDNSEAAESTTIEVNVPEFEAFTGPETFGEVFDHYERNVLKARNEAVAAATENYLSELAKKKLSQKHRCEEEQ